MCAENSFLPPGAVGLIPDEMSIASGLPEKTVAGVDSVQYPASAPLVPREERSSTKRIPAALTAGNKLLCRLNSSFLSFFLSNVCPSGAQSS